MCPGMSLQFVTARKALPTEDPAAGKRPLSCVQTNVCTQQGRLPEGLPTTDYVTDVLPLPNLTWPKAIKTKKRWLINCAVTTPQFCYPKQNTIY